MADLPYLNQHNCRVILSLQDLPQQPLVGLHLNRASKSEWYRIMNKRIVDAIEEKTCSFHTPEIAP